MEWKNVSAPRIMIAAPKSGSGKTLFTAGLLRLLTRKGFRAGAFKCGPDYIDPMFHREALHLEAGNLDTFFTEPPVTRGLLLKGAGRRDLAVIEGVMGYFDGIGTEGSHASSFELAAVTETPVVLAVDASGMSRSLVPLIKGFADYGEKKLICGVLLNRVSGMLYPRLKTMIEKETGLCVFGYLPKDEAFSAGSRHLGLVLPDHRKQETEALLDRLADVMEKTVDLEGLIRAAFQAPKLDGRLPVPGPYDESYAGNCTGTSAGSCTGLRPGEPLRIGIARDEAFSFYYEENLELLREMGAEPVLFSPLTDRRLPEVQGLIFGGGYPELYAEALQENAEMRTAVKKALSGGMPALAECGGFMYLKDALTDAAGRRFRMCGVLPGESRMTEKLVRFGYVTLTEKTASDGEGAGRAEDAAERWTRPGAVLKGHEFHYADSTDNGSAFRAERASGTAGWDCMKAEGNLLAGFPHLYWWSCPDFAGEFLRRCARYGAAESGSGRKPRN